MTKITFLTFIGIAFVLSGCTAVDKQTANSVEPDINQNQEIQTDETVTTKPEPKAEASYSTSALCTDAPTGTEIGRNVYPIDPKYDGLRFLGQLFTAYNCGLARVDKIFGVDGDNYTLGSAIWLKNNPSQSLINTFESIGLKCDEETSNVDCKKWELWDTVKVDNLMKLEPYHENFEMDDCRNCG